MIYKNITFLEDTDDYKKYIKNNNEYLHIMLKISRKFCNNE